MGTPCGNNPESGTSQRTGKSVLSSNSSDFDGLYSQQQAGYTGYPD